MTTEDQLRPPSEVFLTRTGLAQRWLTSLPTIKRREADGTLKPVRLPGCRAVRYRLADILKLEKAAD